MKIIYFVRHGETAGNTGALFQGPDTPLNERGKDQARVVSERFARLPIEALITSATKRTQQTADLISKQSGIQIESSELFVERTRPPSLINRSQAEPEARRIDDEWTESFFTDGRKVLDGEDFFELRKRTGKALRYLEQRTEHTIGVVTHGFFLRMLFAYLIFGDALTPPQFKSVFHAVRSTNTAITVFEFEESHAHPWRVRIWNDHAHLG